MKIAGTATLTSPVEQVWAALNDPAVLQRTLPGCESLDEVGPDRYAMVVTAGVASIKGTYEGTVEITGQVPPGSFVLKASGAGAPGTVDATVQVRLVESAQGGTDLTYDADAVVGGVIGGVGQRMLAGVAKRMAGQFFGAVDADLRGEPGAGPAVRDAGAGDRRATAPGLTATRAGWSIPSDPRSLLVGVVVGAVVALSGVALGARAARRAA